MAKFFASESVSILVPSQPIPISYYLRQPQRLIHALTEQSRVEILENHNSSCVHQEQRKFQLKMQPLHFLHLTIQPTVDMDVWADTDGTVNLRSSKTEIRGIAYINQRFSLNLVGQIRPKTDANGQTRLIGKADLNVSVEMPSIFLLTPPLILEITGNSLLKSVLLTIKQRLLQRLISDYIDWAKSNTDLDRSNCHKLPTFEYL